MKTVWTPEARAALVAKDRRDNLVRLTWRAALVAVCLLLGVMFAAAFSGCGASPEARKLIAEAAVVTSADLGDWQTLTPEQHWRLHYRAARAFAALNYAVNDKPIPPQFQSVEAPK